MKKVILVLAVAFMLVLPGSVFAESGDAFARLAQLRIDTDTDIMGARLGPALYALAARADMDIIVNSKLDGTVIARLTGKTVLEALELLSRANNFNWAVEGSTIICTPAEIGTQTKSFAVIHGDMEYAAKQIETFVPKNKIAINPEYGTISVNGTPATLALVEKKLQEFQRPVAQVHIQAQIVEFSKSDSEKLGLGYEWGAYSGTWPPTYAVTANAEGIRGKGKLLSRPNITTFNGREAKINMGEKVPVFSTNTVSGGTTSTAVEYKDIGMYLTVTPRINQTPGTDESRSASLRVGKGVRREAYRIGLWERPADGKGGIHSIAVHVDRKDAPRAGKVPPPPDGRVPELRLGLNRLQGPSRRG